MFGAVIAQGRDDREVFQEFRPGFDLYDEREKRAAAGLPERFCEDGPYQDVRPALRKLRADGLWLGIAGNQAIRAGKVLPELFTDDVDLIGTSDDIDRAVAIQALAAREVRLLTCDTGQHTRGRAAGLKVTKVPTKDPGPEPDWEAQDRPGTGTRAKRRERQAAADAHSEAPSGT